MSPRGKQATVVPAKKIGREDIEQKLRELQGEVDEGVESAKPVGVAAGVGLVVIVVILAFLFGRRRGKKRQMVLEIRRI